MASHRALKKRVTMKMILQHYGRLDELRNADGCCNRLRGCCPLPTHGKSAKSKKSFMVHIGKNIWRCESATCRSARGKNAPEKTMLAFVAIMESCSIDEAAQKIMEWFPPKET